VPSRVHIPNGILISSAILQGSWSLQTNWPTDRPHYSLGSNRPHLASAAMWPKNTTTMPMPETVFQWLSWYTQQPFQTWDLPHCIRHVITRQPWPNYVSKHSLLNTCSMYNNENVHNENIHNVSVSHNHMTINIILKIKMSQIAKIWIINGSLCLSRRSQSQSQTLTERLV